MAFSHIEAVPNYMSFSGADINITVVIPNKYLGPTINEDADIVPFNLTDANGNPKSLSSFSEEEQDAIKSMQAEADSAKVHNIDAKKEIILENIQTFSYSIHRDTDHARGIGSDTANGMVKGQTVIAGTAIFTVIKEHILQEVFENIKYPAVRIDQLPPLDLFLDFTNEAGDAARLGIFGVEFVNEGQVMSIHDLITENSVNYFATAIYPMRKGSITPNRGNPSEPNSQSYEDANAAFEAMKGYFL